MKLLDDALTIRFKEQLPRQTSPIRNPFDRPLLVHFYNPAGYGDWFITEAQPLGKDWMMYGYCDLGFGPECSEWGYVSLQELENLKPAESARIEKEIPQHQTVRQSLERNGLAYFDHYGK